MKNTSAQIKKHKLLHLVTDEDIIIFKIYIEQTYT